MKDFADHLRDQLAEEVDGSAVARLDAAARREADGRIRRRRIGIAGSGTLAVGLATAVALNLPVAGTHSGGGIAPAAAPTSTVTTSATTTSTTTRVPSPTTLDPTTPTVTAPKLPNGYPTYDHPEGGWSGYYYAAPELARPGEPVPYLRYDKGPEATPTPLETDEPEAGQVPRALPNPADGPFKNLILEGEMSGASPRDGVPAGTGCDPSFGTGPVKSIGGRSAIFSDTRSLAAKGDGDTNPALYRASAFYSISTWPASTGDVIGAMRAGKLECVFGGGPEAAPVTAALPPVAGADSSWFARPSGAPDNPALQGYTTFAYAQVDNVLQSYVATAPTQAEADRMAQWFITESVRKLKAETK